jgi:uncharacterized protein
MKIWSESQAFLDGLEKELQALPLRHQLAYAAVTCERHFGDYRSFSQDQNWGDPTVLREAFDTAWTIILGRADFASAELNALLAKCIEAIPDSSDFSMPSSDYAQNVAIMVVHLVEFMKKPDLKFVVQIATLARDLVDAKIQITENLRGSDPELEKKISNHPLMISELSTLQSSLVALEHIKNEGDLAEFRSRIAKP